MTVDNNEHLKSQIKQIIADTFEVDVKDIDDDISANNHDKWESLNHIHLILALEEHFSIDFTDSEIMEMLDLQSMIETVQNKLSS